MHHILIIGEAASKLSDLFKKQYDEIPWSQIINMRNILVHEYFGIDEEEVWNTVTRDLPVLKEKIQEFLDTK